ncbi:hypothetical protein S1R3Y_000027 [Vibrio phage vB_ValP_VA-RY-3]|nr:hypothetical protein S1R3Y_000027 [Vibrio phage vB_ValP_VA-RY-3]
MANIGKLLKKKRTPEQEMMYRLNEIEVTQDLRGYNGLSSIGNKCVRQMQLVHYDCYQVTLSKRILRLFNEGHRMEPVLVEALKELGIVVENDQTRVVGVAGHWKGHIDGEGHFLPDSDFFEEGVFLTEFKTHNDKSFKDLLKNKVKASKPGHYDQMQAYMGYRRLPKALYVSYNKNDSTIYIEWVEFDPEHFKDLQRKEGEVIMAEELLPRIGNDKSTWFECKMCDARKVCFGKEEVKPSCKNCKHVDVLDDGVWRCTHLVIDLIAFPPCQEYKLGEMFWELN